MGLIVILFSIVPWIMIAIAVIDEKMNWKK